MTQAQWIVQQGYREGNLIPVGTQPSAAEMTEGLYALNRLVDCLFGYELGENLRDWLYPAPQRTAPVAARFPQAPLITLMDSASSSFITPYPPTNRRIIFGGVNGLKLYFPEQPNDGSRMAIAQGSGAGDNGAIGTAEGSLTQTSVPTATHTVTINGQVYTWVAALTAPDQVLIGLTVANSLSNLEAAINNGPGEGVVYGVGTVENTAVYAVTNTAIGVLTVIALQSGTTGNSIGTSTTDPAGAWAASTLSGGSTGSILTLDGNGRLIQGDPAIQLITPIASQEWFYRADLGNWLLRYDMGLYDEMLFPRNFDDFFICALSTRFAPRYSKVTASETIQTAKMSLSRLVAQYRQTELTTYGAENIPRTDQSYLGGLWWW